MAGFELISLSMVARSSMKHILKEMASLRTMKETSTYRKRTRLLLISFPEQVIKNTPGTSLMMKRYIPDFVLTNRLRYEKIVL